MTCELKIAIKNLMEASEKYKKECINKYGRYIDDTYLYVQIVSDAWHEYLNLGGSRTMINL